MCMYVCVCVCMLECVCLCVKGIGYAGRVGRDESYNRGDPRKNLGSIE